jgi:hypothetical protein
MTGSHWRNRSNEILFDLFDAGRRLPSRRELRDAYPFGERKLWPYRVWLSAVREWKRLHTKRSRWEGNSGPEQVVSVLQAPGEMAQGSGQYQGRLLL